MIENSQPKTLAVLQVGIRINQKEIKTLSDMTFGQYVRLLEEPSKFEKLKLNVDKGLLVKQLE